MLQPVAAPAISGTQQPRLCLVKAAGKALDQTLEEAGIDRADVYLTNVTNLVKHFKWAASERGKRRIHQKPRLDEIEACRRWRDSELRIIQPQVLVCLGATAAQALGKTISGNRQRRQWAESRLAPHATANRPSLVHRACADNASRLEQMKEFVADRNDCQLASTASALTGTHSPSSAKV